jgi:acetylornithine deacetylase/succinyl-diaminopimelate desuccinylase-like protein
MSSAEKLLRELVALPSVNPAFMPEGDVRAGEKRVAEFLAATAARAGLDVEMREVFPERANVLARVSPAGTARSRVVLAPHTDTVGESAMPNRMFQPVKQGDRLYGRGSCDTKGSIAAMFTAVVAVANNATRPRETEIVFAALVDEENYQSGSRALVKDGFRADLAIIGEPTRLQVITAHKGDLWLTIQTSGKAAHGAQPELGRNAVHEMAGHRGFARDQIRTATRQEASLAARPARPVNVGQYSRWLRSQLLCPTHAESPWIGG